MEERLVNFAREGATGNDLPLPTAGPLIDEGVIVSVNSHVSFSSGSGFVFDAWALSA
jgi:hypothetical protein